MRGEEEYSSVDVVEELCVRPGDGTGSSSSSCTVLLNIQSATTELLPMPSSSATSSTDARRAFDSRGPLELAPCFGGRGRAAGGL